MDTFSLLIKAYAVVLSLFGIFASTKKLNRFWKSRHLRKVWGIKNGDSVVIVCSELDNPEERQNLEPREFIYSLKFGDLDAYIEVVVTILRLFPDIRLRVMSSGEAQNASFNLARHLILVGGPDYNAMTARILRMNSTQFGYRSPYLEHRSDQYPDEIVLHHTILDCESCHDTDERDFGYFERIANPSDPNSNIILLGGCHTIGVTGAVKAFSMFESEHGETPKVVMRNAKIVARGLRRNKKEFAVLFQVERLGQNIGVPVVHAENVSFKQ